MTPAAPCLLWRGCGLSREDAAEHVEVLFEFSKNAGIAGIKKKSKKIKQKF